VGLGAVAEIHKVPLILCWQKTWACSASFHELFEPCCEFVNRKHAEQLRHSPDVLTFRGNRGAMPAVWPHSRYYSWVQDSATADEFEKVTNAWRLHLKLCTELRQRLDDLVGDWPSRVVGVHIRRTDHSGKLNIPRANTELSARLDSLIAEDPDLHFFIASDNAEDRRRLQYRLGSRFLAAPTEYHCRGKRRTSVQQAVVELYALARTESVLGTAHSSFSRYAANLGAIPLEIYG
jgi:hypothetical protein